LGVPLFRVDIGGTKNKQSEAISASVWLSSGACRLNVLAGNSLPETGDNPGNGNKGSLTAGVASLKSSESA
jgi:hypothetical protein